MNLVCIVSRWQVDSTSIFAKSTQHLSLLECMFLHMGWLGESANITIEKHMQSYRSTMRLLLFECMYSVYRLEIDNTSISSTNHVLYVGWQVDSTSIHPRIDMSCIEGNRSTWHLCMIEYTGRLLCMYIACCRLHHDFWYNVCVFK